MSHQHDGHSARNDSVMAITTVDDSGPRERFAYAILTDLAFSIEVGAETQQAIVVKRLHDRHSLGSGRVVGGGRDEREEVVDRHDIRTVLPDGVTQRSVVF